MATFRCGFCAQVDQNTGACTSEEYLCLTKTYFKPICKSYDRLCNSLAGAYVAPTTVCQQQLWTDARALQC